MNTEALENCLRIISYWQNENEELIKELLSPEQHLIINFSEPFKKELNKNLLNTESSQGKIDILKYYVFEFWELQAFFKEYETILFGGILGNYTPVMYEHTNSHGQKRKLTEFENYVVNSHILFDMIFGTLQLAAFKYGIEFDKICSDLRFDLGLFDSGISLVFEELNASQQHQIGYIKDFTEKPLYDIALSFAGEDRDYVEKVAIELKQLEVSVFYDTYERADLWGKDLYQHLNDVYKNKCKYCIIFISSSYAKKLWPKHELKSAQSRAFIENYEYILPVRFDKTEIPGLNSTIGYLDVSEVTPHEIALLAIEKLR